MTQILVQSPNSIGELLVTKVWNQGIFAQHNFPCPCCRAKHAILDLSTGIMQPCGDCASRGYQIVKKKSRRYGK